LVLTNIGNNKVVIMDNFTLLWYTFNWCYYCKDGHEHEYILSDGIKTSQHLFTYCVYNCCSGDLAVLL